MDIAEALSSPEFTAMYREMALRGKNSVEKKYRDLNERAVVGYPVMAGDSIAEYFPVQELLDGKLYSRGVGGDTTGETMERLPRIVFPLHPRCLFLWVGTNDIQEGISLEVTLGNMDTMLSDARKVLPGSRIVVISVCPVNIHSTDWHLRSSVGERNNEKILAINAGYRELARKHGCDYLDVYEKLARNGTLPEEFSDDGLHLTVPGYRIVCDALAQYL